MTLLTRRSLLRMAALSPLIIPGRSLARMGGAAAPGVPVIPPACGTTLPVPGDGFISSPGCYALTGDITVALFINSSNVSILGNGHALTASGTNFGFGTSDYSGIYVENLVVNGTFNVFGSVSSAQAATPAVHLKGLTVNSGSSGLYQANLSGSNILLEQCTFNGSQSGGSQVVDDNILITPFSGVGQTAAYVTIDSCSVGPGPGIENFDICIEGFASAGPPGPHWDHVTVKNCHLALGHNGAVGGWYGSGASSNYTFVFRNCIFTGNTVSAGGAWEFPLDTGTLYSSPSDADAMAHWGPGGIIPTGSLWGAAAGGPPNIYV